MNRRLGIVISAASFSVVFTQSQAQEAAPLTLDDCIRLALAHSATVKRAQAELDEVRAQGEQVEAMMSPSLSALSFVAPVFGAEGGFGLGQPYRNDLSKWGPYVHGSAQAVLPLTTFGRLGAAGTAVRARTAVEREKLRERQHAVRAEVRRLYYLRLYALSMIPSLENGRDILRAAIERADELFEQGSGDVTVADRMKLAYGRGEIDRYLRIASDGAALAAMALNHAMGRAPDTAVVFADTSLSLPEDPPPALAALLETAARARPEVAQLEHGKAAADAWREAESKAYLPTLFGAAVARRDWSPVRPKDYSSIGFNAFNDWFAGVALGLQLDFQPAKAGAKVREAAAKGRWVAAQEDLARTGIPLQVRKAYQEAVAHRDLAAIADEQVKATRKWMTFSAAGYKTGTAEAKDVLEGVGAYLLSKKAYYEHLLGLWQSIADLELFTGTGDSP